MRENESDAHGVFGLSAREASIAIEYVGCDFGCGAILEEEESIGMAGCWSGGDGEGESGVWNSSGEQLLLGEPRLAINPL